MKGLSMWRNDSGLSGKSVVVTGAAGGIGSALVRGFAQAGAHVLLIDLQGKSLQEISEKLPGTGHQYLEIDLSDLSQHALIFETAQSMAPLAAVAHSAAVSRRRADVDDVTEADWDIQIDTNLKTTFFLNRAARTSFRSHKSTGSIINFVSQAWWSGGYGGSVVYAASKGGVVSLTKGLARAFAADGVRVNAISPGGVDTPMMVADQTPEALAKFVSMIPLGRLADPEELVGAVLFLASDASSYVTGTVMNVSGGQLMY
jgi:NAD(P)-dependent dehydrogenase (short-subunit alcohol dehydrogenase family)